MNASYVDRAPHSIKGSMRKIVFDLLQEHDEAGTIPTSVRFLYYELVGRGICSKQKKDSRSTTQVLTDALTDLRQAGVVPWNWIVDETRALEDFTGAESVTGWVENVLDQARLDPWAGKPPLVLTESRSLAGVLRSTAIHYAVRIASTNGQVGGFLHTDIIPRLNEGDRVLYLGDHDLAGNDIEANTRRVLEQEVGPLEWERLALTAEQVEQYNLPTYTKKDRRFKNGGGVHEAVETEALSQQLIVNILTDRLEELLPMKLEAVLEREARQRKALRRVLKEAE
jgi:hypothetical protein